MFEPEVKMYIEELHDHATKLWKWNNMYDQMTQASDPPDYDSKKVVEGRREEAHWLVSHSQRARDVFAPYLELST